MSPDDGLLDALRLRISPEAGLFLGSLRESFGPLWLLYDGQAPDERERLRWAPALREPQPEGYSPWACCACGTLLVTDADRSPLAQACLDVDLVEQKPGSTTLSCTGLYLSAHLWPLGGTDLALRRALEAEQRSTAGR